MVKTHYRPFLRRLARRVFVHTALGDVTGRIFFEVALIVAGAGLTAMSEGGYTGAERLVLFTVVNNREVPALREIVSQADPDAFMVVSPSHEVLGEGFKPLTRSRRT
jgi:hypothetical protein